MPIRHAKTLTFRAKGLTDATDATNAFGGSMQSLQNLIPNPNTQQQFIPRPASVQLSNFSGFATPPTQVEVLYVVGTRAYGMLSTGRYPGKSEPFCYDLVAQAFIQIANVTAQNTPNSQSQTGDWTPSTMAMIANKIIITHPGYDEMTNFIGWIDVSGFKSTTITGNLHSSTLVDGLSSDVLQDGWTVGQAITAPGISAGTYITAIDPGGLSLTLSQPASSSAAGVALTVTGGTFAAPVYGAGQVVGAFPFTQLPVAVSEFNGRAYYAVGNGTVLSDSLQPLQVTGAGGSFVPILTMGDSTPVTALAGVPLANQVIGGVVQSIIAFKGAASYYQVTGDPATNNLANNVVEGSVGTLAPNSIAATPLGVAYMAPDGLRIISLTGTSSQPIGSNGQGVCVPFQFAISPTRMCAAYNQNVYRCSVQNGYVNGEPLQEYWYDFNLQIWTGPHTFPSGLIAAVYQPNNGFILAPNIDTPPQVLTNPANGDALINPATGQPLTTGGGFQAGLWFATAVPPSLASSTENGQVLTFVWQPSLLPDNGEMAMNSSPQGALGMALPANASIQVQALNELGAVLQTVIITGSGANSSIWGTFDWGAAVWGTTQAPYQQYTLPWPAPLVFKQGTLRVSGSCFAGFAIGNAYLQYQPLGYVGAAAA